MEDMAAAVSSHIAGLEAKTRSRQATLDLQKRSIDKLCEHPRVRGRLGSSIRAFSWRNRFDIERRQAITYLERAADTSSPIEKLTLLIAADVCQQRADAIAESGAKLMSIALS